MKLGSIIEQVWKKISKKINNRGDIVVADVTENSLLTQTTHQMILKIMKMLCSA